MTNLLFPSCTITIIILLTNNSGGFTDATTSCGKQQLSSTARVINGVKSTPNQWPWQAQIKRTVFNERHHCGGTLIHPLFVLTAAHCLVDYRVPMHYKITLGEHDLLATEGSEQTFTGIELKIHPSFDRKTYDNDIALIKLNKPALLNDKVNIACLPNTSPVSLTGKTCVMSGWGVQALGLGTRYLLHGNVPIVSNDECAKKMNAVNLYGGVTDNMVCAGGNGQSSCHGDSGGPLVCKDDNNGRYTVNGVVSWGHPKCESNDFYGVFARVDVFAKWIDSILNPTPVKY